MNIDRLHVTHSDVTLISRFSADDCRFTAAALPLRCRYDAAFDAAAAATLFFSPPPITLLHTLRRR